MNKETIFISHSSKDKEAMNYFQKLLMDKTSNIFSIFLSSDGQSIPFGTNWIHKIEEGLNDAKVMFVFITKNSVQSSWIYFEAGFAYSKGIKVIPIGIGIDVNTMRPPLNLLQGFNINSYESMNNCIKIINDEFDTTFEENVKKTEYLNFVKLLDKNTDEISNVINCVETDIKDYLNEETKQIIEININEIFSKCKKIIENYGYEYTFNDNRILSTGIMIEKMYDQKIIISMNVNELQENFTILKEIMDEAYVYKKEYYINIILDDKYDLVVNEIKVSSIIKKCNDIEFRKDGHIGFKYKNINFLLKIMHSGKNRKIVFDKIISIYWDSKIEVNDIISLIKILKDIGIIYFRE